MRSGAIHYAPISAFIGIWVLVLVLSVTNNYNFKVPNAETVFILLSGISSLFLGYILVAAFIWEDKRHSNNSFYTTPKSLYLNDKLLTFTVLFESILMFLGSYMAMRQIIAMIGSSNIYFTDPLLVRNKVIEIQLHPLGSVPFEYRLGNYFINIGFACTILGGVLFTSESRLKWFGLIPLLSTSFASFVFIKRFTLVSGLVFWGLSFFYVMFYYPKRYTRKLIMRAILVLFTAIGLLSWFTYFIYHARTFYIQNISRMFWRSIYAYIIGGVSSLDIFITKGFALSWGASLFRDIVKWLARFHLMDALSVRPVHEKFVTIAPGLQINTYTFIRTMLEDYGYVGMLVISFLWGGISRWMTEIYENRFSLIRLSFLVLITFSLIMSFYSFYFRGLTTITLWVIVIIVIDKSIGSKMYQLKTS